MEENMRTAIYLTAILNILLGLLMIYRKPDVFRGKTLKDHAQKTGDREAGLKE